MGIHNAKEANVGKAHESNHFAPPGGVAIEALVAHSEVSNEVKESKDGKEEDKSSDFTATNFMATNNVTAETMRQLFLSEQPAQVHVDAIKYHEELYFQQLKSMLEHKLGDQLTVAIKARILAACVANKLRQSVDWLLSMDALYGIAEVLRAVQLLDAPRRIRQSEAKLKALIKRNEEKAHSVKEATITALKTHIHNLQKEIVQNGSVSGAFARKLRKWLGTIPAHKLEFYLLTFPPGPWKLLADVIHSNPKDFKLDYFQSVAFGSAPPEDSMVAAAQHVTRDNVIDLFTKFPRMVDCYSFIRRKLRDESKEKKVQDSIIHQVALMGFSKHQAKVAMANCGHNLQTVVDWIMDNQAAIDVAEVEEEKEMLTDATKALVAQHAPLEDVIWFYEELDCKETREIVSHRLEKGERIEPVHARSNYGKLMERLLLFRERHIDFVKYLTSYADALLHQIHIPRAGQIKVGVFGDASGSMEVAIKSSTIVGSLLSVALQAELSFFREESFKPETNPRGAQDVVTVVEETKAEGGTSMAAALWPYYERKQKMDLFILVSDEGENRTYHDLTFAELFAKYRSEVCDSTKLFLVSFVNAKEDGKINKELKDKGIECKQFRLDPTRPDTSKFDNLLGLVTLETSDASRRWDTVESALFEARLQKPLINLVMSYDS